MPTTEDGLADPTTLAANGYGVDIVRGEYRPVVQ